MPLPHCTWRGYIGVGINYVLFALMAPYFLYLMASVVAMLFTDPLRAVLWWMCPMAAYLYYVSRHPVHLGIGAPVKWVQRLATYKWTAEYFPIRLHRTVELDPKAQYIFVVHPHSIIPTFLTVSMLTQGCRWDLLFPGIELRGLAASSNFVMPIWRQVYLSVGYIDAGYESGITALKNGHSLALLPGGEQEMIIAKPNDNSLILQNRKGFARLALETGARLVPVYAFGANDIYNQLTFTQSFNVWLSRKFRMVLPIFYGRWGTPLPQQRPIDVVIGAPLEARTMFKGQSQQGVASPELDALHAEYMEALQAMFDKHKKELGHPDAELVLLGASEGHAASTGSKKHSNKKKD